MARLAGVDLPVKKRTEIGLTYIYGIGRTRAKSLCHRAGIDLTLRLQPGYDHSYYFISTFMADHVAWHAARLR